MKVTRYKLNDIDPIRWNDLVLNQRGFITFYDWASIDTLSKYESVTDFFAYVLEDNDTYQIAIPGVDINKVFHNLFFQPYDNLDVLVRKGIADSHIDLFITYFKTSFRGMVLKNFCSDSILYNINWCFIKESNRNCPYFKLPGNHEEIFSNISKSFKKTLRWNINGFSKLGFEFSVQSSSLAMEHYDRFTSMHASRMIEKNISSGFLSDKVQGYFKMLNIHPLSNSLLSVAKQNGEFMGAIYGIKSGNTYSYVASGIRSNIGKFSLGQVLIFKTMEYLIQNKFTRFDFLRGNESYKLLWSKEAVTNSTRYYYKLSSFIHMANLFFKNNSKRFGRLKCFSIISGSLMNCLTGKT